MGEPRVLQLITDTDRRGPQVASGELARGLAALGVPVRTVALRRGDHHVQLDVPVIGGWRAVRRLLGDREVDVVLAQGSTTLWAAALATAGTKVPFVYRSIGDTSTWAHRPDRRVRFGVALRRAAGVVALWPDAATYLVDRFRVRADRVAVIPQVASADRFAPVTPAERAAARAALGVAEGASVVLVLGALSAEKRVDDAIAAVAHLDGDAVLLVGGDGPCRKALEDVAATTEADVRFVGSVDDVLPLLASADVVLLTSSTEGVPGVLVEAGMRGLPAVATAVGGVPSVVVDGVTGVLAAPGDVAALAAGLRRALAEPGLGAAAREHCLAGFELAGAAERWRDLLVRATTSMA